MSNYDIPEELKRIITSEKIDFAVKARRHTSKKKSIPVIGLGVFWLSFMSIFLYLIFGSLILDGEVHFESNSVPTTASWDNLRPLIAPGIGVILFTLIGITIVFFGVRSLFQEGGYFVGTSNRFIQYRKGKTNITDWKQFSGNLEMNNKGEYGEIIFELRNGTTNSKGKYTPSKIYMVEIPDVYEIEKKCRQRIRENDPNPTSLK